MAILGLRDASASKKIICCVNNDGIRFHCHSSWFVGVTALKNQEAGSVAKILGGTKLEIS